MSEIRYGLRSGPGKGHEHPVDATEYFHRLGGHFVTMTLDMGRIQLATALASQLYGWAEVPKDAAGYNAWVSSSTAGKDKAFVITGFENKFEMPYKSASTTASVNASLVGRGCTLYIGGSTYTTIQYADYRKTAASCLLIVHDVDTTNETVLVSIKPDMAQPAANK